MAEDDTSSRVIDIIAGQAGVDPGAVTPATTLEELGIDSLRLVEAIFAIEEAFDISVPYNANDPGDGDFASVGAIVEAVSALVRAGKG